MQLLKSVRNSRPWVTTKLTKLGTISSHALLFLFWLNNPYMTRSLGKPSLSGHTSEAWGGRQADFLSEDDAAK